MWSQLWETSGCAAKTAEKPMVQYVWDENSETDSLLGSSCPFKSSVITGFIVITARFLRGRASQGSNLPVSTHINGLIGLFTPSQNPGLSLTEMLSPQSPSRLNTREMHDATAKWSRHYSSLLIHIVVTPASPLLCVFLTRAAHISWHQLEGNFSGCNFQVFIKKKLKFKQDVLQHFIVCTGWGQFMQVGMCSTIDLSRIVLYLPYLYPYTHLDAKFNVIVRVFFTFNDNKVKLKHCM